MILREKEFCDFLTGAIEKSMQTIKDPTLDDALYPKVRVMQLVTGSGFWITADVGSVRASLGSVRNETRRFASIDSAASFIRKLGVVSFEVVNLDFNANK